MYSGSENELKATGFKGLISFVSIRLEVSLKNQWSESLIFRNKVAISLSILLSIQLLKSFEDYGFRLMLRCRGDVYSI